jgi:hypothetical protein
LLKTPVIPVVDLAKFGFWVQFNSQRLVVANRHGLWDIPNDVRETQGLVFDPAPVSPNITSTARMEVEKFLDIIL